MSAPTRDIILDALKDVFDPELGYNIVDLGLIYEVEIDDGRVMVTMTLTTPGCPASDMIQGGVRQRLEEMDGVDDIDIALVWEPPWSPQAMSPVAQLFFGIE